MSAAPEPAVLLKGSDPVLLGDAVRDLVHDLVGDDDRALVVDELDIDRYEQGGDADIAPLVDAAQTPPFLTDRRVVVARHAAVFASKDAVAPLVAYLGDPLPTTALVLVWEAPARPGVQVRPVPKSLVDAIGAAGGRVVDTAPGKTADVVARAVAAAGVTLDAAAQRLLVEHVGTEANRVRATLDALESTFGPGARLGVDDITPYLGSEGAVQTWDLTDAIDDGDVAVALDRLHRLLTGGEPKHPLQILATLHHHYSRMLRLDGAGVGDERQAAALLGTKPYPAKKALAGARRLGSDRLAEFTRLLAQADLDLRGAKHWPPELVVEVLVARLATRSRAARAGRAGSAGGAGGGRRRR
jgi:DNA polymerase III subunit delta